MASSRRTFSSSATISRRSSKCLFQQHFNKMSSSELIRYVTGSLNNIVTYQEQWDSYTTSTPPSPFCFDGSLYQRAADMENAIEASYKVSKLVTDSALRIKSAPSNTKPLEDEIARAHESSERSLEILDTFLS